MNTNTVYKHVTKTYTCYLSFAVGNETMMAPSVYQQQQREHLVASNVAHPQSPLPPPSFVLTSSSREEESPGSPHSLIMADDVDSAIGDSGSPDINGKRYRRCVTFIFIRFSFLLGDVPRLVTCALKLQYLDLLDRLYKCYILIT
jgi:hypothetical protein